MTEVPHEICELARRIDEAKVPKVQSELDIILDIINEMTPENRELLHQVLAADPPHAERRQPGQESAGDALGEVGTPRGNRSYIMRKIRKS